MTPTTGDEAMGASLSSATETAPAPPADRFRMAVPADWTIVPLNPANRDRRIAGIVEKRLGKADNIAYVRRRYIIQLRKAAADAASRGGFFAALHNSSLKGLPLLGSVVVSMAPQLTDPSGNPITDVEVLAAQLGLGAGEDDRGEVLEHSVEALQVGLAARVRRRSPSGIQAQNGTEVLGETVQYYVPLPEAGRTLAFVFSTPLLSAADAYVKLFDVMALSASWVGAPGGVASAPAPPLEAPEQVAEAEETAR